MHDRPDRTRRRLALGTMAGLAVFTTPVLLRAETLQRTVRMMSGPFYPDEIPLDHDNDLVQFEGKRAAGTWLDLAGRVLGERGRALDRTRVEIWQCDANSRYHHVDDGGDGERDPGFQGYGEFVTAADGRYRFRTIRPVPYGWRTGHVHFRVSGPGFEPFTTQMFVAGEPRNAEDGPYGSISDPAMRAAVTIPLEQTGAKDVPLRGRFDIVLVADGRTAAIEPGDDGHAAP
jgi:protocatechuate 3,4-dioxygenase beta subunit